LNLYCSSVYVYDIISHFPISLIVLYLSFPCSSVASLTFFPLSSARHLSSYPPIFRSLFSFPIASSSLRLRLSSFPILLQAVLDQERREKQKLVDTIIHYKRRGTFISREVIHRIPCLSHSDLRPLPYLLFPITSLSALPPPS
jgi:hypothetical protein